MRAALRKLYAWEPLQRYEVWREERICRRVSDYPETFRWVEGVPLRLRDRILGRLTGNVPWVGWRNWASKWIV